MRSLDESREVLYVIRTLDVLMGSGVGGLIMLYIQEAAISLKEDMGLSPKILQA